MLFKSCIEFQIEIESRLHYTEIIADHCTLRIFLEASLIIVMINFPITLAFYIFTQKYVHQTDWLKGES